MREEIRTPLLVSRWATISLARSAWLRASDQFPGRWWFWFPSGDVENILRSSMLMAGNEHKLQSMKSGNLPCLGGNSWLVMAELYLYSQITDIPALRQRTKTKKCGDIDLTIFTIFKKMRQVLNGTFIVNRKKIRPSRCSSKALLQRQEVHKWWSSFIKLFLQGKPFGTLQKQVPGWIKAWGLYVPVAAFCGYHKSALSSSFLMQWLLFVLSLIKFLFLFFIILYVRVKLQ